MMIYDTMLARARSDRLGEAVVQQLREHLVSYLSLDVCTDDDLNILERLGMPSVLVSTTAMDGKEGSIKL